MVCLLAACGDDGSTNTTNVSSSTTTVGPTTDTESMSGGSTLGTDSAEGTTEEPTTMPPTTDDSTTTSMSESATDSTSSSTGGTTAVDGSTTTGGEVCATVLCGMPEVCCELGEECVLDQCLAACDTGIRCGALQDTCCDDGQVCLEDTCVDPGGPCGDSFDCEADEFCEPTLGECLPQFDPVGCEFVPDFDDLSVVEEWSYTDEEVIAIPVVADIDGDDIQEVVAIRTQLDDTWEGGGIVVLDGTDGSVEWVMDNNPGAGQYGAHGRSTPGLADVNGDGLPDIIFAGVQNSSGLSIIRAVDGFGTSIWNSHDADASGHRLWVINGAPSFANFDSDPEAEIVFGAAIIDNDGLVVWDQDGGGLGAEYGSNCGSNSCDEASANYVGGITAIADLTGDGYPEIISGRQAWWVSWDDSVSPPDVELNLLWDAGGDDGYPAVVDLDADGDPEVILVSDGEIRALEGDSGLLWCGIDPDQSSCAVSGRTPAYTIPSGGRGGPPTVADFDGDGRPEVGLAAATYYVVFDFNRSGETVVVEPGYPFPANGRIYPRWIETTQDGTSHATGSSVFDFQGDGAAEVIYGDECYLRVYDGSTGNPILEIESSSSTIHEYPLVVDVDGDRNSEIIAVTNVAYPTCDAIPFYNYRQGITVYGDQYDQWVPTREVWTSHAYHVTNATSAGNVPASELDNWTQPGLNNYRQNVQGEGVFNAPDLTVDLNASLASCDMNLLDVVATVRNQGALGVPAGIEVRLYAGTDDTGLFIGSQLTADSMLPGGTTNVTWQIPFDNGDPELDFYVTVDGDDAADGIVTECAEDNNNDTVLGAECIFPG